VAEGQGATDIKVKLAGSDIDEHSLQSFSVDQDLGQPDMCTLVLANGEHQYSKTKPGDEVEVKAGSDGTVIFKGEVVALEPKYVAGEDSKCIVRAYNKLHRLLRGRKSKTYLNQKDSDIASAIASDNGLSAQAGSTAVTHEHIYQHNQTDLEFLRARAARLGYEVWVEDTKLYFDAPALDQDSGIELRLPDPSPDQHVVLKAFAPKLSSAKVVKEVTVRGWDPQKKEEIVGKATASGSSLGGKNAVSGSSDFGDRVTYEVDHPIFSVDEAKKIAEARLAEHLMGYITGEGTCVGAPDIKAGIVVKITVNNDDANDPFNGKYLVVGATHKYSHNTRGDGGYLTVVRVSRDAQQA
jgi:uncharacterized protein